MGRVTDVSNHGAPKPEQRPARRYSLKWWTSNIILCTVFVVLAHVWSSRWSATRSARQLAHWLGSQCALGLHPIDLSGSSRGLLTSFHTSTPVCTPITGSPNAMRILALSVGPLTTIKTHGSGRSDPFVPDLFIIATTARQIYVYAWNMWSVQLISLRLIRQLNKSWKSVYW